MAVAECGSIARAAERLHLTQPSVSIQVRKLSEALELPLYEVLGKRLHLTDAGREVVAAGRELFATIGDLDQRLNDLKGLESGQLRIAVVSTAKYFLPRVLGGFLERHPNIDVQFDVGNRSEIIARMQDNRDDLYIFAEPPTDLDITCHDFLPNPLAVISSVNHHLADSQQLSWEELAEERFILREPGSGTLHTIEAYLASEGLEVKRRMTVQSNEAIKHTVMANMGVTILSAYVLANAEMEGLTQLPVSGFPIMSRWQVAHWRDKRLSLVASHFLNFMLEHGRDLLPMKRIDEQVKAAMSRGN